MLNGNKRADDDISDGVDHHNACTAVHFNHNITSQLFTYELYIAHILQLSKSWEKPSTAEWSVCACVCVNIHVPPAVYRSLNHVSFRYCGDVSPCLPSPPGTDYYQRFN